MAKYWVTCSECGAEHRISLYGSYRSRAYAMEQWVCDDCRKRQLDDRNAVAAKFNRDVGLPPLTGGTPKQIAWAESIRAQMIPMIDEMMAQIQQGIDLGQPRAEEALRVARAMRDTSDASWWIDHRNDQPVDVLKAQMRR